MVTGKVANILRHSAMLGNSTWLIFFKVANAVVKTVLGSCSSHFLCHKASLHKVISASRLKGEGNESSWIKTIFEISTWNLLLLKKKYIYYETSDRFPMYGSAPDVVVQSKQRSVENLAVDFYSVAMECTER